MLNKIYDTEKQITQKQDVMLEPRVAKLEVGLDRLAEDVRDLVGVVRNQGVMIEDQIQKLVVTVTQASGPRKIDWSIIISGVLLVMALGSAVFWPLNQTSQNNKDAIGELILKFENHKALDSHPVSAVLLNRIEEQMASHILLNDRIIKEHIEQDNKEFASLDKKLQVEYGLMNAKIEAQIIALDSKLQLEIKLLNLASDAKIDILNKSVNKRDDLDMDELRAWRNKASGLSSPAAVVPVIPTQITSLLK